MPGEGSFLVFHELGKWGFICLHNGKRLTCKYQVKLMGGTPKGKPANHDDIEPLIVLSRKDVVWN